MKTHAQTIKAGAAIFLFVWLLVSQTVFAVRHPWSTEMERLIYLPRAMMFQSIDYDDARNR